MPWRAGATPVTMVVWAGKVTLGMTLVAPVAWTPSRMSDRRVGICRPSLSASR
jgi:hypothetical protein